MRDKYRLRIAKSDRGWRRSYGVTSDMEPEAKNFSRSKFSFDLIIKKIINFIRSDSTFTMCSYISSRSCLSLSATDMFNMPPRLAFMTQIKTVATNDTV